MSCFEYLQGWRFHNLSGRSVSVFSYLPSKKAILLQFEWNFLYFSLCLLPLVLSLGTSENTLSPSSFLLSQLVIHRGDSELPLLQAEQSQLSQVFLSCQILHFLTHLQCPSLDLLECVHVCVVLGSPPLDTAIQLCPTRADSRGSITSFNLLAVLAFAGLCSLFYLPGQ